MLASAWPNVTGSEVIAGVWPTTERRGRVTIVPVRSSTERRHTLELIPGIDSGAETRYHRRVSGRPPSELALGAAGYRLTGPRRALADLIAARDGHFTAAELLSDARV